MARGKLSRNSTIKPEQFRLDRLYLYLIFLSYLFLIPQIAASTRFRMPIEPLLALFACITIDWWRERSNKTAPFRNVPLEKHELS
jgi:hypothetical protein